jgi:hypothetical protein
MKKLAVLLLACLLTACAPAAAPPATATPIPPTVTDTPAPTATPEPTNTPKPTRTPKPTSTHRPPPTKTPVPDPILFTGTGDSVIDIDYPWDNAAQVDITHTGSAHFAIWSYDENNERIDLLVNTSGKYKGRVLIDILVGEPITRRMEITADGAWTITVLPLGVEFLHLCYIPGPCEGEGDDVLGLVGDPDTMQVDYPGNSYFSIWSYGPEIDLLVNESGPYAGRVLIQKGTVLFSIHAEGPWTLDITAR